MSKDIEDKRIRKVEDEEDKKRRLWPLFLYMSIATLLIALSITYSLNEDFKNKVDSTIIDITNRDMPTAPEIYGGSKEWATKRVIKIKKDAKSKSGISYYEYCISESQDFSKCKWKKTETKNNEGERIRFMFLQIFLTSTYNGDMLELKYIYFILDRYYVQ